MAAIAASNECVADRVLRARPGGAGRTLVKIARVLVKRRWEYCPTEKVAASSVSKKSAPSFTVAGRTLSESRKAVSRLLDSGADADTNKGRRVDNIPQLHGKLLLRIEWSSIPDVADIKVGDDAQ